MLCCPIKDTKGDVIGCVQAINKLNGKFDKDDEHVLEAFSSQAAISIINSRNHKKLAELTSYFQSHQTSVNYLQFSLTSTGIIHYVSDDTQALLGVNREELREKHYSVLLGDDYNTNDTLRQHVERLYNRHPKQQAQQLLCKRGD